MLFKREVKIGNGSIGIYVSDEAPAAAGKAIVMGVGPLRGRVELNLEQLEQLETAAREAKEELKKQQTA